MTFRTNCDEAIRDKFVCGLCNETMQKRLLAEKNLTLAVAIEIAQGMEAANKQTTELRAATGQSQLYDIQLLFKARAPKPKKKCYRCGRTGHLAIYLQFVTSKTRNVETMTKLVTLLKCANPENHLSNKLHRGSTAVGHVINFNNVQTLNKLDT